MHVRLLQVPYMMGDDRCGSSSGPGRFVGAGADRLLVERKLELSGERIDRGVPFHDSGSSSLLVCKRLAAAVKEALDKGQFPLILGGGCDVSKGVLAGFDHSRCGIVWIDAHADFNTPETTVSGYLPGMSLAILAGHCFSNYWAQIGDSSPVPEESILMLGVRELDPAEAVRLLRSRITVIKWQNGQPDGDMRAALQSLAKRVSEVYLHIDMDSLDPTVAPGVADTPVPGGLSLDQLKSTIRITFQMLRVKSISLVVYNPERDQEERTLLAGLEVIDTIAESLAGHSRTHA